MINTFWLILNYTCNNRCVHCYAPRNCAIMPYSYAQGIIDTMISGGIKKCLLIGGEPTLYPNLREVIDFIRRNSEIKMTLVTNGRELMNEKFVCQLIEAGLHRVVVSVEGPSNQIHDSITQVKGSYKQTIQGIRNCLKCSLDVETLTTINKLNADYLSFTSEALRSLGVAKVGFNCGLPFVDERSVQVDYILPPDEIACCITDTYIHCRGAGIKVNFNATIPICLIPSSILEEMIENNSVVAGCQMYHGKGVAFDPFGNILPCTHFASFPLFCGVKSKDNRFTCADHFFDLWTGGKANEFRDKLWRYPSLTCKECKYWGACVGGCPLLWSFFDPADYIPEGRRVNGGIGVSGDSQWIEGKS